MTPAEAQQALRRVVLDRLPQIRTVLEACATGRPFLVERTPTGKAIRVSEARATALFDAGEGDRLELRRRPPCRTSRALLARLAQFEAEGS